VFDEFFQNWFDTLGSVDGDVRVDEISHSVPGAIGHLDWLADLLSAALGQGA
jgi:hypothetical protein